MLIKNLLAVLLLAVFAPIAARADEEWEHLADGSLGRVTEFRGVGASGIPAYIRKPAGGGPFPVVVVLHGGKYGKATTFGLGRSAKAPIADFLKAGWAVYSIDYRPSEKISIEAVETDDTLEAVKVVRQLPFIDAGHVGLFGASHGANVASRVISRVDLKGAILCAPLAASADSADRRTSWLRSEGTNRRNSDIDRPTMAHARWGGETGQTRP